MKWDSHGAFGSFKQRMIFEDDDDNNNAMQTFEFESENHFIIAFYCRNTNFLTIILLFCGGHATTPRA